jgi:hypothetical protein
MPRPFQDVHRSHIGLEAVIKTVCGMDAAVELIGMY